MQKSNPLASLPGTTGKYNVATHGERERNFRTFTNLPDPSRVECCLINVLLPPKKLKKVFTFPPKPYCLVVQLFHIEMILPDLTRIYGKAKKKKKICYSFFKLIFSVESSFDLIVFFCFVLLLLTWSMGEWGWGVVVLQGDSSHEEEFRGWVISQAPSKSCVLLLNGWSFGRRWSTSHGHLLQCTAGDARRGGGWLGGGGRIYILRPRG